MESVKEQLPLQFEKGKIFLPQLIMAADVAKVCFDEVKNESMIDFLNGFSCSCIP